MSSDSPQLPKPIKTFCKYFISYSTANSIFVPTIAYLWLIFKHYNRISYRIRIPEDYGMRSIPFVEPLICRLQLTKRNFPFEIFQNRVIENFGAFTYLFNSAMVWGLTITERNKQKRQSQMTLSLPLHDAVGKSDDPFTSRGILCHPLDP